MIIKIKKVDRKIINIAQANAVEIEEGLKKLMRSSGRGDATCPCM